MSSNAVAASATKMIRSAATENFGISIGWRFAPADFKASNEPGTLSMANTGRPNSGGSQFFVNTVHNAYLDWFSPGASKHPVFGKVIEGMDVVRKIEKVRTDPTDRPVDAVKMIRVTISK